MMSDGASELVLLADNKEDVNTPSLRPSFPLIKNFPAKNRERSKPSRPSDDFEGQKLAYHPLTLILIIIWVLFAACLLFLLEQAAKRSLRGDKPIWYFSDLPTSLLTIFAQGHASITAMYLSRLGVSALQYPSTAPRSWAELFWLADRTWQGPLGLSGVIISRRRLRIKNLSTTFTMFAFTSILALPAPVLLSRAYPIRSILSRVDTRGVNTTALVPQALQSAIATYSSETLGWSTWTTGQPAAKVYRDMLYTQRDSNNTNSSQVHAAVFSGQLDYGTAALEAVRMSGGCSVVTSTTNPSPFNNVQWDQECNQRYGYPLSHGSFALSTGPYHNFTGHWCAPIQSIDFNFTYIHETPEYGEYKLWTAATQGNLTFNFDINEPNRREQGLIDCSGGLDLGSAQLDGPGKDYTFFSGVADVWHAANTNAPPTNMRDKSLHSVQMPFFWMSTFNNVTSATQSSEPFDEFNLLATANALGFERRVNDDYTRYWVAPAPENLANQLWDGVLHMTAAFATSLQQPNQTVRVTDLVYIPRRVRSNRFAVAAISLLVAWLAMLILSSLSMFRPAVASSLNSYAAARLLAEEPSLVVGHCCGDLDKNKLVAEAFDFIGDTLPDAKIGHVASGGDGTLQRRRLYRGGSLVGA